MGFDNSDQGDLEKLKQAFAALGSVESILEAFGLSDLPTAQRYGIVFGFLVFSLTVCSVLVLMILGGTFERIKEQAITGEPTLQEAFKSRKNRALLLERLLDARERLLKQNYSDIPKSKAGLTNLTKMLMSTPPPKENDKGTTSGYKDNYVAAYRRCQDKPGGSVLAGRPEARYEAYARAYASCGDYTSLNYRRSYARMYEALACQDHKSDDKYSMLYTDRPNDIVGKTVRLEALDVNRHLDSVFKATSGMVFHEHRSYDPYKVWGFLADGPFQSPEELRQSFVFQHQHNQGGFAVVDNITERVMGCILLSEDRPENLSIQMETPILNPVCEGTQLQLEACFLLLDRLFANGYRRIAISIDSQDTYGAKLAGRLGFTYEGCLLKHMIIKESSRDSNVYGMLNSDWDKGARMVLYKKLYGASMARADDRMNKKEAEREEQQRVLAEQKLGGQIDKDKKNS